MDVSSPGKAQAADSVAAALEAIHPLAQRHTQAVRPRL